MNRKIFILLSPVLLAACGGGNDNGEAQSADQDMAAANATPNAEMATAAAGAMEPQQFANQMAASDAYEIQSSQLALEQIQSGPLRDFAQQMVSDHERSSAALMTAAGEFAPTPTMTAQQEAMLEELRGATGEEFARLYQSQQRQAHQMTLDMLNQFAAEGQHEGLRAFASQTSEVVAGHLQMLNDMGSAGGAAR